MKFKNQKLSKQVVFEDFKQVQTEKSPYEHEYLKKYYDVMQQTFDPKKVDRFANNLSQASILYN